ncbi:TRAP transporter small permease subunit [Ruicaihuangia caeni]|uniref:TRAP transporter small permease subunit n=1 Tax=Ruicaihuangia caeni TaxID=3042517 RepID=A0AAW6T4X5_9MICO|nr:TRAP transporter small permease subunit [Klugiella sp. YN-L-19]MDI2098885.1 TRAP transporter small permease subunit [Klugiella sp. YN-L-19]
MQNTTIIGRVRRVLSRVEVALGVVMMVVVVVGVALQVLQRYLHLTTVGWSGEVAMMGLVVLSLFLAGYLAARDQHITLEFIDGLLRRPRAIEAVWFVSRLIVIVVAAAFAFAGIQMVDSGVSGNLSSVAVPKAPFFIATAAGFLLVVVDVVLDLVERRGRFTPADRSATPAVV